MVNALKKLSTVVLIFSLLTVSALAATTATVTSTPSATVLKAGDTITVTVTLENCSMAKSIALSPVYNADVFILKSGEWKLTGALIADFNAETGDAVLAYSSEKDLNGTVFSYQLQVKEDALAGNSDIKTDAVITLGTTQIASTSVVSTVTVKNEQPQSQGTVTLGTSKTVSVVSNNALVLPLYINTTDDLTAFHAELSVPSEYFEGATVKLAEYFDNASDKPSVSYNYLDGMLIIGMAGSKSFNSGTEPLLRIILTPKVVTEQCTAEVILTSGKLNGTETIQTAVKTSVTILSGYSLTANVLYFSESIAVPGVQIQAGAKTGTTNAAGVVTLTDISSANVTVTAEKNLYVPEDVVNAFDAVLVLQHCVKKISLTDDQKIAGDVNGNGVVDEVDASLILQYAVSLIKTFDAGSWSFRLPSQSLTLATGENQVSFIAVLIGDVDGSWGKEIA